MTARTTLTPVWTVLRAGPDGKPSERVWRLPRIRWPGLLVWDHVSSSRGRYELMTVDHNEVCEPTGFRFRTLAALESHLKTL